MGAVSGNSSGPINVPPGDTPAPVGGKGGHKVAGGGKHGAPTADVATQGTGNTQAIGHRNLERAASGAGWATLSPNELDQLQPGDPVLLGTKGVLRNSPPRGAGGTGNPFFGQNPMTSFFMYFSKIQEAKKWLELVGTKLAVQDMKTISETGKDQANATLQAGQASYTSEMGQAWTSLAQAGIGVIGMGVSVGSLGMAMSTANKEIKQAQKQTTEATEAATSASKNVGQETTRLENRVAQKQANLDKLQQQTRITQNAGEETSSETAKMTAKTQQRHTEVEQETASVEELSDDTSRSAAKRTNIDRNETEEVSEAQDQASSDLRSDNANENEAQANELQESISKDQARLNKLQWKNASATQRSQEAGHKLDSLTGGQYMRHVGDLMQQNPVNQIWQGLSGALNSGAQTLQHWFKGTGDLNQAYWNSKSQLASTAIQILSAGLTSMTQLVDTNYQEANAVSDALSKISDQEQTGFSWRG